MVYCLIMLCIGFIIGGFASGNNDIGVIGIIGVVGLTIYGLTTNYMKYKRNAEAEQRNAFNSYYSNNRSVKSEPIKKSFLPKGQYNINKFIKEEALNGGLEDIDIIVGESTISKYERREHNIYISEADNETPKKFLDALLRCFQQAVCVQQGILYSSTPSGMRDNDVSDDDLFDRNSTFDDYDDEEEEDDIEDFFDEDEEEFDDSNCDDDSEEPIINMLGEVVNKKTFAEGQKIMGGFFPDWSSPDDKFSKYQELKNKKARYGTLTPDDESKLIFPLIFGNYDCRIDLDKALAETNDLLTRVLNKKPTDNCVRENEVYMNWLHEYAIPQILLGTIYAYQNEYVKAAYHFMLGLKTEQIAINMPYCDFIKYILGKLPKYVSGEAKYDGCGFSADNVMGSCGGTMLIAENALKIIPEMEGKNGEVIVARMGNTGMFGHLERKGSTYSETASTMVDIYETFIIDRDYNVKKVFFYFNGYFSMGQTKIKIAKGFKLKSHSLLHNSATIIEA